MTTPNVASLDLCRELYELSGWEAHFAYNTYTGNVVKRFAKHDPAILPAYDLGYLLRKLPKYIGHASQSCRFGLFPQGFTNTASANWCASYDTYKGEIYLLQTADTPEDAACKLAVELFKQDILQKEAHATH